MGRLPAVLAVDGGNSKADLALLAADGTVQAAVRRLGFSHQAVGIDGAARGLAAGADALRDAAGLARDGPLADVGAFCLAGADLPVDDEQLTTMLAEAGLCPRWSLHNDVFAVLRAGTEDGIGVAVVCGAGMNAVGVAPDGRHVRYPALGEVSGDLAAGGGWLGRQALAMAIRAEDGRGAPTALERIVPEHYGRSRPLEVTEAIYLGELDLAALVDLAPAVMGAALAGDEVAMGLVTAAADELVTIVRATLARLDLLDAAVPVVLGGGLFRAEAPLRGLVIDGVRAVAPGGEVRVLEQPPIVGSALLGFDDLGTSGAVAEVARQALQRAFADTVAS